MNHEETALLARAAWETTVWPTVGDMGAMLFGVAHEAGVLLVTSPEHPVTQVEAMLTNPPPADVLDWVGWVGTGYTDNMSEEEFARIERKHRRLQDDPSPTTAHVLIVSLADKEGHASIFSWALELGPELVWGEQVNSTPDNGEVEGAVPDALRALMAASR